ncbi:MAG: methylated-DNA--[protein]-cysteine S-methyltransferase [Treponema sp.]|nr:methylated-DNA--[protein]-cysteine S-methyltransferase [Treponema sp.]
MKEAKIHTVITETPLGKIQAAACDNGLRGLWFIGQKYFPQGTETWIKEQEQPVFAALLAWLDEYFSGKEPKVKIPLSPVGTDFQQAVWKQLLSIPYGKTTTYGAIAARLFPGKKAAAQAVGGAVGHNPISLLIPCHRVLGADGSLTGYAGGLERKQALLDMETLHLTKKRS